MGRTLISFFSRTIFENNWGLNTSSAPLDNSFCYITETILFVCTRLAADVLLESKLKNNFLKTNTLKDTWARYISVDGHIGCCWHCTGDLSVFMWSPKTLGQPDRLECSLAELVCRVTFNQFPRGACLALSSAFYKVPQSQAVHKQVGIIIKYDYSTLIHPQSDSHSCHNFTAATAS